MPIVSRQVVQGAARRGKIRHDFLLKLHSPAIGTLGLVQPSRSHGRQRLYSQSDVARLRHIQRLIQDLGVNLAGVEVIIRMNERVRKMEEEMERLRAELQSYRDRMLPVVAERDMD